MRKNIETILGGFAFEIAPGLAMQAQPPGKGIKSEICMYKIALLEKLDSMTSVNNQIRLDLSAFDTDQSTSNQTLPSVNEYQTLLQNLLLLALPTPSHHLH